MYGYLSNFVSLSDCPFCSFMHIIWLEVFTFSPRFCSLASNVEAIIGYGGKVMNLVAAVMSGLYK